MPMLFILPDLKLDPGAMALVSQSTSQSEEPHGTLYKQLLSIDCLCTIQCGSIGQEEDWSTIQPNAGHGSLTGSPANLSTRGCN